MNSTPSFRPPSAIERWFNRLFGILAGLGIGLEHNYRLSVAGRKSGRIYSTPVNLLSFDEKVYLVAPRGETQWVKNVRAGMTLSLKRGAEESNYSAIEIFGEERVGVIREYLKRYARTVSRYFEVKETSSDEAFERIAQYHPVFELVKR